MKSSATQRSQTAVKRRATLRVSPIAAACSTLLFALGAANAQQANLDTVTVTGIRHAIESSIATKRNSDSIVEAISAEDIGKLPDSSIAESLARLPGLAAQRGPDGRAAVIAIRGMSPDFAGTLLNGREQTTTGTNRGVEYDQYPSELMSGATVYKTPDATLLGQGISGTVDLHTIRPLDMAGRAVNLNARGEVNSNGAINGNYGGTSDKGGRFSVSYVDQFADRTVGIAVGFAHLDSPSQEKHYQAWNPYNQQALCLAHTSDWGCSPGGGLTAADTYSSGFEIYGYSRKEIRDGLMGTVEFKPNKDIHSTVDLFYSKFSQTEVMRGLQASMGDGWGGPQGGNVYSNIDRTNAGGVSLVTGATITGGPAMTVRNDYNTRDDKLSSLGWNTEAKLAGGWKGIADLSYSNAKRNQTTFQTFAGVMGGGGFFVNPGYNYSAPPGAGFATITPLVNMANPATVVLGDPGGYGYAGLKAYGTQDDTIKAINLHAKHDLSGIFSTLDAGVDYSERDKNRTYQSYKAQLNNSAKTQAISAGQASSVSLGYAGVPAVLAYDANAIANQYYTFSQSQTLANSGGTGGDYGKDFGIHEKVTTAYAKADIDTELAGVPIRGNLGVQAVHTSQNSNAYSFDKNNNVNGTINPGTQYNDFLPSLNLVASFSDDKVVRLGVARQMARPRIDDMNAASSASVSTSGQILWSGSGGNPTLKPWLANSVDLSFEKYFGKRSYVAAAVFYKDLLSYIYNKTIPNYNFAGYVNPTPQFVPSSTLGNYSGPANGTGGSMRGVELSGSLDGGLLSKSLDGFGVQASTSITSSSIEVLGPNGATQIWQTLPGLSKNVTGLTLFYEKDGYAARISDRYRSDFRGDYTVLFGNSTVVRTLAQNTVDLQASYEIQKGQAKGLTLQFQILNATNTPDRTVQDGTGGFATGTAPLTYQTFGRQYLFGVNYKM